MNVPHNLVTWIFNFLTNRSQYVRINQSNCVSNTLVSSTGAPQGTALAPFLFIVYTSDARSSHDTCPLIKFADDTALVGLITGDDGGEYLSQINWFVDYCDQHFLELNVEKTKEMVIDFRKGDHEPPPVVIKDLAVNRVSSYKYLGVVLDDQLNWHDHIDYLVRRINPRLYCLRKLNTFNISRNILSIFYNSVIFSVWSYCVNCWGGNVNGTDRKRIDSIISQVSLILGERQQSVNTSYHLHLQSKLAGVLNNSSHPLHINLESAIIPRSGRMRLPRAVTNRYKSSFIPRCIKLHNESFTR
ncbi:hypothetical protein BSL78_21929 [Apostichopus japonicus]|uniref:Reverse transcriptase domain-containing protein n=1 Tax=Stichopus japonicus TaxID=307972 RepID=A0A2G8JZQ3_STIJA|nr:hypothetical protein BSL78_21929 [Apostichopus japonicus]